MPQVFVSQQVVTPFGTRPAAVLVERGKITALRSATDIPADASVVDCSKYVLMPGLVDAHTHINEPGRTEWEGFETATRAAAAGGFTTLMDMPLNCLPATTTVAALAAKRATANGKCTIDWGAWGGVSERNTDHLEPLAAAGVRGFNASSQIRVLKALPSSMKTSCAPPHRTSQLLGYLCSRTRNCRQRFGLRAKHSHSPTGASMRRGWPRVQTRPKWKQFV